MGNYSNLLYGWSFSNVNGKVVELHPSTEGMSEDEVKDLMQTIGIDGEGLSYTLTVDGKEKGTVNIPADMFLNNVECIDGNIKFVISDSAGDTHEVTLPVSEIVSEDMLAEQIENVIAGTVYTKAEVDQKISSITDGADEALDTFKEVGEKFAEIEATVGQKLDTSAFNEVMEDYYTKEETDAALSAKSDASDVYTKDEADEKFLTEHQSLDGYASVEVVNELDALLIETKRELTASIGSKAEKSETYSKEATDNMLSKKLDVDTYDADKETFALKTDIPTVPKKVTDLEDAAEFATIEDLEDRIEQIIDGAPENLNTLKEISEKLKDGDEVSAAIIQKISDEVSNREAAVEGEAAKREEAVNAEAEARTAADDALQANIDAIDLTPFATKEEMTTGDNEAVEEVLSHIWSKPSDPDNGYFSTKHTNADGSYAMMWNESDGGGSMYSNKSENLTSYVGVNDGGKDGICVQIYSKDKTTNVGARLNVNPNGIFYGVGSSASTAANDELAVKGDIANLREEVAGEYVAKEDYDTLNANYTALQKDYNTLKDMLSKMDGANVTWEATASNATSYIASKYGTVKLTEEVNGGRVGSGVLASNKVTLNLNSHNMTLNGGTVGGILTRGSQELTITGKGTIENTAANPVIWCASEKSVINLTGRTTTYVSNNPDGECIYCELGVINISNGTFKGGGSNFTLNCKDANYKAGTAKIVVTGGKFYDFDPANNAAEGAGTSFVAEGYVSVPSTVTEDGVEHTIYTVKKAS